MRLFLKQRHFHSVGANKKGKAVFLCQENKRTRHSHWSRGLVQVYKGKGWRRPIPPSFFLFSRSRPKQRATVLPTRSALVARPPRNPFQRRRQLLFDCGV